MDELVKAVEEEQKQIETELREASLVAATVATDGWDIIMRSLNEQRDAALQDLINCPKTEENLSRMSIFEGQIRGVQQIEHIIKNYLDRRAEIQELGVVSP